MLNKAQCSGVSKIDSNLAQQENTSQLSGSSENCDLTQRPGMNGLCGGPSFYERSFFPCVVLLIMMCLIARVIYLSSTFVQNTNVKAMYSNLSSILPVSIKYVLVLYVCRFKLNLIYLAEQRKAPEWVRPLIFAIELTTLTVTALIPFGDIYLNHSKYFLVPATIIQFLICIIIMVISVFFMAKIIKIMYYGKFMKLRKWLLVIEVQLQLILWGHMVVLLFNEINDAQIKIICFLTYMFLTELLPFVLISINMVHRIIVFCRAQSLSQSI